MGQTIRKNPMTGPRVSSFLNIVFIWIVERFNVRRFRMYVPQDQMSNFVHQGEEHLVKTLSSPGYPDHRHGIEKERATVYLGAG
jgi:hypothetical protein